ncbi:hypothetical protein [Brevibacillus fulvus]|uniref:Uncharacterized protein n=1 Tax=Brevibacillus fulvus TaxID=1125967 RepID=A0A938XY93_9BACL|nr:hypothetical protein [Brevibacillus fulvus]MBM7590394.1 hypothetical protein [Brevibacillus fulvus]
MDLMTEVQNRLSEAYEGRRLWIALTEKLKFGNRDYVIVMPSLDAKLNYVSLLYLDQFAANKKAEKIYLVTLDEKVKKAYPLFTNRLEGCIDLSEDELNSLIKFYSLYMFTDKLVIMSFARPQGRTGENLIGKKGITLEELVSLGLYQNEEFVKEERKFYSGTDPDVAAFFQSALGVSESWSQGEGRTMQDHRYDGADIPRCMK